MRVVEVLMSIPSFFLMLLLNAYLKPGITTLVLIIGLLTWMDTARIVRAETLSVKSVSTFYTQKYQDKNHL